jgi:DNA polymerase alpha subunit A
MKKEGLPVDGEWYLIHQILPPLERVCTNVDGTDRMRLAEAMGIDVVKHKLQSQAPSTSNRDITPLESSISDKDRFKDARKLVLTCPCSHQFVFKGVEPGSADTVSASGINCPGCKQLFPPLRLNSQLEVTIRGEIAKYYASWLVCDDSSCNVRTRQVGVYGKKCLGRKGDNGECSGVMSYEYTDRALYNQLLYFDSLFDVDKAKKNGVLPYKPAPGDEAHEPLSSTAIDAIAEHNRTRFSSSRRVVGSYLENCGRRYVDMHSIFSFM